MPAQYCTVLSHYTMPAPYCTQCGLTTQCQHHIIHSVVSLHNASTILYTVLSHYTMPAPYCTQCCLTTQCQHHIVHPPRLPGLLVCSFLLVHILALPLRLLLCLRDSLSVLLDAGSEHQFGVQLLHYLRQTSGAFIEHGCSSVDGPFHPFHPFERGQRNQIVELKHSFWFWVWPCIMRFSKLSSLMRVYTRNIFSATALVVRSTTIVLMLWRVIIWVLGECRLKKHHESVPLGQHPCVG